MTIQETAGAAVSVLLAGIAFLKEWNKYAAAKHKREMERAARPIPNAQNQPQTYERSAAVRRSKTALLGSMALVLILMLTTFWGKDVPMTVSYGAAFSMIIVTLNSMEREL